jgi:beta-carotene/zeaxanthin 4-ketolase
MTHIFQLKNSVSLQVTIAILGVWAISLWKCVQIRLDTLHPIWFVCLFIWQTWLYTGLFIIAHDAMHGSIYPSPKVNRAIGQFCLWFYAGFDYPQLCAKHHQHHKYPASDRDPDFHNGEAKHFWGWFGHFVSEHITWRQVITIISMFATGVAICHYFFPQPLWWQAVNLACFWVFPSLVSSLQLFYFGTFLPHREPVGGYIEPHRAETIPRSRWWSLISCYHFGYHRKHHESPQIPWWQLYE